MAASANISGKENKEKKIIIKIRYIQHSRQQCMNGSIHTHTHTHADQVFIHCKFIPSILDSNKIQAIGQHYNLICARRIHLLFFSYIQSPQICHTFSLSLILCIIVCIYFYFRDPDLQHSKQTHGMADGMVCAYVYYISSDC